MSLERQSLKWAINHLSALAEDLNKEGYNLQRNQDNAGADARRVAYAAVNQVLADLKELYDAINTKEPNRSDPQRDLDKRASE